MYPLRRIVDVYSIKRQNDRVINVNCFNLKYYFFLFIGMFDFGVIHNARRKCQPDR